MLGMMWLCNAMRAVCRRAGAPAKTTKIEGCCEGSGHNANAYGPTTSYDAADGYDINAYDAAAGYAIHAFDAAISYDTNSYGGEICCCQRTLFCAI